MERKNDWLNYNIPNQCTMNRPENLVLLEELGQPAKNRSRDGNPIPAGHGDNRLDVHGHNRLYMDGVNRLDIGNLMATTGGDNDGCRRLNKDRERRLMPGNLTRNRPRNWTKHRFMERVREWMRRSRSRSQGQMGIFRWRMSSDWLTPTRKHTLARLSGGVRQFTGKRTHTLQCSGLVLR